MNTNVIEPKKTIQIEKVVYTGKTHTTGGRDGGSSLSSDGNLNIKLTTPGKPEPGTNPEQLLAAGWSACFIGAMRMVASKMKVRFPEDGAVDAEVDLNAGAEGYFLSARLNVSLPGIDHEIAKAIVEGAHQVCPYSKATRGNVNVEFALV